MTEATRRRSAAEIRQEVRTAIEDNDVVLFVRGTASNPKCGFSKQAIELVEEHRTDYVTVDVLEAPETYRRALADHSNWETLPQAYVDGEFVGDDFVLGNLKDNGELGAVLAGT